MPVVDRRINPQVADGYPLSGDSSTNAALRGKEERRIARRRSVARLAGDSASAQAKADWIKDFLRS